MYYIYSINLPTGLTKPNAKCWSSLGTPRHGDYGPHTSGVAPVSHRPWSAHEKASITCPQAWAEPRGSSETAGPGKEEGGICGRFWEKNMQSE